MLIRGKGTRGNYERWKMKCLTGVFGGSAVATPNGKADRRRRKEYRSDVGTVL